MPLVRFRNVKERSIGVPDSYSSKGVLTAVTGGNMDKGHVLHPLPDQFQGRRFPLNFSVLAKLNPVVGGHLAYGYFPQAVFRFRKFFYHFFEQFTFQQQELLFPGDFSFFCSS